LKIHCPVIVTQQRPEIQQFSSKFRNPPVQAKKRTAHLR